MATKLNRCRVKSCRVVISEKYHFCYHHRMWSLHDIKAQYEEAASPTPKKPLLRRFFCDPCGTVMRSTTPTHCTLCGSKTEELD